MATATSEETERLNRLTDTYRGRWRIWRTRDRAGNPAGYVATNRGGNGYAPTIHAATLDELEAALAAPPRAIGYPSLATLQRALERL
ncbi:hypothetical protein [Salinactinospora qingdaonensis]|uniref:Uncharacterized protein n=1 Tax=Salinactinospora qingdaonensis TaxID=702744 RepID=A0ABP7F824_9ACTN